MVYIVNYLNALLATVLLYICLSQSLLVNASTDPSDVHRKLSLEVNPGCDVAMCKPSNGSDVAVNLVHVAAAGPADTIHYIWSTIGAPSVLIVYADTNSHVSIDWVKLLSHKPEGSIRISGEKYSFALVFSKLWEFDDRNDTARIDQVNQDPEYITYTDLSMSKWQDVSKSVADGKFSVVLNSSSEFIMNGSLQIELRAFTESGRHTVLPRLYYTSNTTQFDVILDRLVPQYNNSRFAIEFELVSSYKPADINKQKIDVDISKSIDDEYTPGVFEILDVKVPVPPSMPKGTMYGGYMEWKPVCYTKSSHTIDDSIQSQAYDIRAAATSGLAQSVARAYYSNRLDTVIMYGMNVSYGMKEDGYYNAANYTFWTAAVGYGTPPVDSVSTTLLIIIAAGVGIPVILILVGGVYLAIKKHKEKNAERTPLLNSEHNSNQQQHHSINT